MPFNHVFDNFVTVSIGRVKVLWEVIKVDVFAVFTVETDQTRVQKLRSAIFDSKLSKSEISSARSRQSAIAYSPSGL